MTPSLDPANRKRIETFKTIVADLKAGKDHSITRLTTIKSLCKDPAVAAAFTKYLASLAAETLATRSRPRHLSKEQWQTFQRLANEGMAALERGGSKTELRQVLTTVRNSQNVIKHIHWNNVRMIECGELFQIELALQCLLQAGDPSRVAYEAARHHAERYDSRYGTGLIPSSAKALEQIIAFWSEACPT
jgi:hypothetical protein